MKKLFLIILLGFSGSVFANSGENLTLNNEYFQKILTKYRLTESHLRNSPDYKQLKPHIQAKVTESSYCYRNPDGEVVGNHIHELRDIASTTKLFSSLFALDSYGTDYRFNTFFYVITSSQQQSNGTVKNKRYLYIQGSGDPTFSYNHLKHFYTTRLKPYGRFDEVHFDANFFAYIYAKNEDGYPSSHSDPGHDRLAQTLTALKTVLAAPLIRQTTQAVEEFINQKNSVETEKMDAEVASIQEISEPVGKILKDMNINSDNYTASVLFDSIPNKTSILMNNGFTEEELENEIRIVNGSGYPMRPKEVSRVDNKASCGAMLKLLDTISDCVGVGEECQLSQVFPQGCDKGLCKRFQNDPLVKQNVVAKTGLTNYVISLVGWLDPVKRVPFAFLITTLTMEQRSRAKLAIDEMVSAIYQNTFAYPMLNESETILPIPLKLPILPLVSKQD